MDRDEFRELKRGDIVRHVEAAESYIVTDNDGKRVTAVRTMNLTRPSEWLLIVKDGKRVND